MKKFCALLLIVLMLATAMPVALAENTTTLTTTVPDATYTLNIPADQEIAFGAESTEIGTLTVTDASGFAVGKNLAVTLTYGDFASDVIETTIPMMLNCKYKGRLSNGDAIYEDKDMPTGSILVFKGNNEGSVDLPLKDGTNSFRLNSMYVKIESTDWGKALGGDYASVITFTAEVVKGE